MNGPVNGPVNDDLTSTLNKRADDFARLGGHDLDLAQVVSRAGEIQRGRRMRASIVMAAVLVAIAVPVGMVGLHNDPARISPAPQPTASNGVTATDDPTPTTSPTPARIEPNPDPISLEGLTEGRATELSYAEGSTLVRGSTSVMLRSGGQIGALARIDGGYLVGIYTGQGETAEFIPDDHQDSSNSWPMVDGSGFAVNDAGTVAALVQPGGQVVAVQDGGSRWFDVGTPLASDGNAGYSVEAIQADSCTDRSETNVCTVWVTVQGQNSQSSQILAVSSHRDPAPVFSGWLRLNDLGTGGITPLFAGMTSVSDEGSCSEVVELSGDTQQRLWKTCENTLETFSPDGRYLLAGPAYRDGPGDGIINVLDARNGKTLVTIKAADQYVISQYVWEDDSHVLAVVQESGGLAREGLLRLGLDGSRELVAPVVDLTEGVPGYRLADR